MTDIVSDTTETFVVVDGTQSGVTVSSDITVSVVSTGEQGPRGPQGIQGERGEQGLQGVPGLQGASGDLSFIYPAVVPLSGHRIVMLGSSGVSYASSDVAGDAARVLGLSTNAAAGGGDVSVKKFGEVVEPSWNWDTQLPVYLGLNGLLTQVPPARPTNVFSMVVGYPITPTSLFVNIGIPITLI